MGSTLFQLDRELAERELYEFVLQAWHVVEAGQEFIENWHVRAICDHLQAVTDGRIWKLLINVPPGCSKSLITSVFWPAWEWARDPTVRWWFSSYDQKLSTRDARRTRDLVQSQWYQERWPVKLKGDQNTKIYYETTENGYRLASTPGGHGTGEHPDRIVFDDPHNVKQAESDKERQEVLDWWQYTMPTRGLSRGAKRVGIMQRLHEDDLAGHVLENESGWDHLCLPMRHEAGYRTPTSIGFVDPREKEGELLAPEQFPEPMVAELEKTLGAYGTAGQLQQRPHPKGGGLFKKDYFEIVPCSPAVAQRVRYWDKAHSERDAADWTAGVLMARTPDGIYYVEDVERFQKEPHDRDKVIRQTAEIDNQSKRVEIGIEKEPGGGGKQSAEISVKDLAGFAVFLDAPGQNKEVRAEPFASQCGAGNVKLVKGEWNQAYIDELVRFPNGRNDDQVDASSGAFNRLALRPTPRRTRGPVVVGGRR